MNFSLRWSGVERRSPILAALVAVSLTMAACTGAGQTPAPSSNASAPPNTTSGRLVVWNYFSTPGQIEALGDMAALFNARYPNVEVVYETQPFEQMTPNLLAAAAAGNGPDVIVYQAGDVVKLVEVGALASL